MLLHIKHNRYYGYIGPKNPRRTIVLFHPFLLSIKQFKSITPIHNRLGFSTGFIYPQGEWRSWFTFFNHRKSDFQFIDKILEPYQDTEMHFLGFSDGGYFASALAATGYYNLKSLFVFGSGCKLKPKNNLNLNVYALHGSKDIFVSENSMKAMCWDFSQCGAKCQYEELIGLRHFWYPILNAKFTTWIDNLSMIY